MTDKECAFDANRLWQKAHNKPDTLPDIGVLINWLVSEIENTQYTITCASEENQQLRESLAEARAEIEKLKTELREISDSCSKSNLEIGWCKCCTSRKWCKAGTALVDALLTAERDE